MLTLDSKHHVLLTHLARLGQPRLGGEPEETTKTVTDETTRAPISTTKGIETLLKKNSIEVFKMLLCYFIRIFNWKA